MKMIKNTFTLLFSLFFICCEQHEIKENKELSAQLTGVWYNLSMKIRMNTVNNTDSSRVFEVDESSWEQKMSIRPIRTIYWADGSYHSEHRNLKDSMFHNPAGRWVIMGDTIIMTDTFPERGFVYKYHIRIKGNIAEFTGMEDCDRDGKSDDNYYGVQRKER